MIRRKPLSRVTALRRKKRLNPISAKRRADIPRRAVIRQAVFARDGYTCQAKGWRGPCWGQLEFHHLTKESQGGAFSMENGLALCRFHNGAIEVYPEEARRLGLSFTRAVTRLHKVDPAGELRSSPPAPPRGVVSEGEVA